MRTFLALAALSGLVFAQGAAQAKSLLAKGEFDRAAKAARTVIKQDKANVDAWLVLADALVGKGEPHDAWTEIEAAMEANPKNPQLTLKLGDVFFKVAEKEQASGGDGTTIRSYYMDAERMYKEAIALDPELAAAYFGVANANFALSSDSAERLAEARRFLGKCLMVDEKYAKAHALQAYMLYTEGNQLRGAGKEDTALEKFRAAEDKYKTAIALDRSDPLAFVRYGHCFYAQGKMDEAKDAYIDGLKAHPEDQTPIVSGLYYVAGRDWRRMAPVLREAADAAPKSGVTWYYLGYAHYVNEAHLDALDALRKAEKLMRPSADLHYYIGNTLEKQNKADAALDEYRKALGIDAGHAATIARFEALILQNRNDLGTAEKMYEELLELAPNNGWVRNNYALILRNWCEARGAGRGSNVAPDVAKRLKRSGEVYEEAAALLPNEPQIQSDTGLLFEFYPANFDGDKAKRYFCRALEISDYTYRDAFDGLNRVCRKTNDWETLRDYAEGVLGAIDRGKQAVAPVGASEPRELPNETPGLKARAQQAFRDASARLKG